MVSYKYLFFFVLLTSFLIAKPLCFVDNSEESSYLRTYLDKTLVVNTKSLQTRFLLRSKKFIWQTCDKDSHYEVLKRRALNTPFAIANRGIKTGAVKAYALTVDMCPSSKKSFEKDFYENLIKEGKPVSISMTYKWALYHPLEFEQLKSWQDSKALDITWTNHGYMHPYDSKVPIKNNFINLPGIDFKHEVLANEAFLVSHGRTPSIFFRFAGLVSNEKAYKMLIEDFGLIPIGSKAWLAKGEPIQEGSIVLLHGNKNESYGIKLYNTYKTKLPVVKLPHIFFKD